MGILLWGGTPGEVEHPLWGQQGALKCLVWIPLLCGLFCAEIHLSNVCIHNGNSPYGGIGVNVDVGLREL